MLFPIFLLQILFFYSYTMAKFAGKKLPECTNFLKEYEASGNLADLRKHVSTWKKMLDVDTLQLLNDDKVKAIFNDLEKCTKLEIEQKNMAKWVLDDLRAHLNKHLSMVDLKKATDVEIAKCRANAITQAKEELAHQLLDQQFAYEQLRVTSEQRMEELTKNLKEEQQIHTSQLAQAHQYLEKEQQLRNTSDQAKEELAKELEEQRKVCANFEQENGEFGNALNNWKIATFVLIGVAVFILAISVALNLIKLRQMNRPQ